MKLPDQDNYANGCVMLRGLNRVVFEVDYEKFHQVDGTEEEIKAKGQVNIQKEHGQVQLKYKNVRWQIH